MEIEIKLVVFALASAGIGTISWPMLRKSETHGFSRFFAWEVILILFLLNVDYWFREPFSPVHIFSWVFLFASLYLILRGVQLFRQAGRLDDRRMDPTLIGIEKTTHLVTSGIYGRIRHPFYSSLLFLAWGICLKHVFWGSLLLAAATTILLVITARKEEAEDIRFLGRHTRITCSGQRCSFPLFSREVSMGFQAKNLKGSILKIILSIDANRMEISYNSLLWFG